MAAAAKKAEAKTTSDDRAASSDYKVTAPLIAIKDSKGNALQLFRGDIVPEDTDQESIDHLLDLEYISK